MCAKGRGFTYLVKSASVWQISVHIRVTLLMNTLKSAPNEFNGPMKVRQAVVGVTKMFWHTTAYAVWPIRQLYKDLFIGSSPYLSNKMKNMNSGVLIKISVTIAIAQHILTVVELKRSLREHTNFYHWINQSSTKTLCIMLATLPLSPQLSLENHPKNSNLGCSLNAVQ